MTSRAPTRLLGAAVAALAACGAAADRPDAAPPQDFVDAADPRAFQRCTGRAYQPLPQQDWRHSSTDLVVEAGDPNHSAQDVIAAGAGWSLRGKFTYGSISKDLQDELVHVVIDDCAGWVDLGDHATDGDGRMAVSLGALPGPGVYEARLQVLGDGSLTSAYVWNLPAGSRLIITDIDGTLTASDSELFEQIFDGSHVPVPYPGAVDLTLAHTEIGYVNLYLTGRPYWLTQRTRDWLADLGFEPGPLHVADSNEEAVPSESGVGDFKRAFIDAVEGAGYLLDYAYGNATTDIYAYLGAGFAAEVVWIIGDNGGQQGTNAVADSWTARVSEVRALPTVPQPFDW